MHEFGLAVGGSIVVSDGRARIVGNDVHTNRARLGGGVAVMDHATVDGNLFADNAAVEDAVGTFPGAEDRIGSGLWVFNDVPVMGLRVEASANLFARNAPHDVVEVGVDLKEAFAIDALDADHVRCPEGERCS